MPTIDSAADHTMCPPERTRFASPDADECVLRYLLERQAQRQPESIFTVFDSEVTGPRTWTYRECLDATRRTAASLLSHGVRPGAHVLCWTGSNSNALRIWFALNYIGAVYVPVNIHYRGQILADVIGNVGASLIVIDADLLETLAETQKTGPLDVAVFTDALAQANGADVVCASDNGSDEAHLVNVDPKLNAWDTQSIIYTSGTTGPSKGVLSSYAHLRGVVQDPYDFLTPNDRYLCNLPLFHVGGMLPVYSTLARGGSVAISGPFRSETFWQVVNRTGSTVATLLSGMSALLSKNRQKGGGPAHCLEKALIIPLGEAGTTFSSEFGVTVHTMYHMSEICAPLVSGPNPRTLSLCGQVRRGVEVRLVDDNDCEVLAGKPGELIVRTNAPWAMSHGYLNNPGATAASWRNGWFHTGDVFREDEDRNYIFVDRRKDIIRRRGENISSFEIEREVCAHPAISDAAALPIPDAHGEDEVLVVYEVTPGNHIEPEELLRFLYPRLPRFMLPTCLLAVASLPRTPTGKIEKARLRRTVTREQAWSSSKANGQ
ncbi:AMP-binding protein [Paraburkholderia sediminicola]|uniref:AMP-binding protein n=1 Tax=Paraburkholderia metrosideri TaxID=580937 RepID=A0ABW9E4P3_9BURK